MKKGLTFLVSIATIISSCQNNSEPMKTESKTASDCSDNCIARNNSETLSCSLTSPELQERKETVLAQLKEQIIEKKETPNGYAFRFPGTDSVIDQLTEFIKTERECCSFFVFNLSISGDKGETWLELSGPDGAKDFVATELGL